MKIVKIMSSLGHGHNVPNDIMGHDGHNVPDDDTIFHEILPKLPVESLIRSIFSCKLWKSKILDPKFKLSNNRKKTLLFYQRDLYIMDHEFHQENLTIPPPCPFYIDIIGSLGGIVLFCSFIDIIMWNPSTGFFTKVLELDILSSNDFDDVFYDIFYGFFYDDSEQDYKVVVFLKHVCRRRDGASYVICSSFKSKKWTTLNFPYEFESISGGTMVNNSLHWIIRSHVDEVDDNNGEDDNVGGSYYNSFWDLRYINRIVYFDSTCNKFKTLPVPNSIEGGEEKIIVGLGVLDGHICMMRPVSNGDETYTQNCDIELLVMKVYGVKASWTRLYYIKIMWPTYTYYKFLELVMVKDDSLIFIISNEIWAYYPKNSRMEMVKIKGVEENRDLLKGVVSYVETLTSPIGYYWNDEEHKKIGSVNTLIYGNWLNLMNDDQDSSDLNLN